MFEHILQNINELWKLFLRPPREVYTPFELGPNKFFVENEPYIRKDFQLKNSKGLILQVSCFCPSKPPYKRPFVIYCHCNSGSRLESLKYAKFLLKNGFGLCCCDFSGSGCSEGEFVTLGYNESEDLKLIVSLIIDSGLSDSIFLWGRSMGAVTALLYTIKNRTNNIKGLILDSPYSNLRNLAIELAQNSIKLPKFMISPIIDNIDKVIKKKANFGLPQMDLIALLKKTGPLNIPAYFITSLNDTVVPAYHIEELKKYWGPEAIIKYITLKHYENRSDATNETCLNFMKGIIEKIQTRKRTNSFSEIKIQNFNSLKQMPFKAASRIKLIKK